MDERGAIPREELPLTDSEIHVVATRHLVRQRTGTAPALQLVEPELTWPRVAIAALSVGLLIVGSLLPAAGGLIPIGAGLLGWALPQPRLARARRP